MTDDLSFRVYLTGRGCALAEDGDGELTLRLAVPGEDGAAVRELLAALRVGGTTSLYRIVLPTGAATAVAAPRRHGAPPLLRTIGSARPFVSTIAAKTNPVSAPRASHLVTKTSPPLTRGSSSSPTTPLHGDRCSSSSKRRTRRMS